MAHLLEEKVIGVPPERVFEAINNYGRRLEWDTLLRDAEIFDESGQRVARDTPLGAGMTVRSFGRWLSGGVVMDTIYKVCEFPHAELEMISGPWFFKSFQAWATLEETGDGATCWKGEYKFQCRPRVLSWLIDPIVSWVFRRETRMRAAGMKRWLEAGVSQSQTAQNGSGSE